MPATSVVMLEALFNSENYQAAKKLMDVSALRQKALLSNLANLETPGYKRVDVSHTFESALQKAVSSQDLKMIERLQPALAEDETASPVRNDGNTVSLEKELLAFNQNTMEHQLLVERISGQIKRLKMAIKGSQ